MELRDWFIRLELSIAGDTILRHQDSHIELETFFRDMLNLVYDWKLSNANTLFGKDQDSFDLSSEKKSLAIQVTVTTTAKKIRKTINSFVGKHDSNYRRLIFVYPNIKIPTSRADFSKSLCGFDFDAKRDRFGLGSILKSAQDFEIDKLDKLVQLVRKELRPLGGQLGPIADEEKLPSLTLPTTDPEKSWLPFSSKATNLVGRDDEMELLREFLSSTTTNLFSWWLVLGSAGSGKIRLALELSLIHI